MTDPIANVEPPAAIWRHLPRGLAVLAACLFVGPPIGGLVIVVAYLAAVLYAAAVYGASTIPPDFIESFAGMTGLTLLFSYMFGGAQALACGAWLGLRTWRNGTVSFKEVVLTATVISVLAVVAFMLWEQLEGRTADVRSYAGTGTTLGLLGIVSAVLVRWLLIKLGILPRRREAGGMST